MSASKHSNTTTNDIFRVVRQLGVFDLEDVVALTGLDKGDVEHWIKTSGAATVEHLPGSTGKWRVVNGLKSPQSSPLRAPATLDRTAAEELINQAIAATNTIGKGLVQDAGVRAISIDVAEQRMQLAESAIGEASEPLLRARLLRTRRRLVKLRDPDSLATDDFLEHLRDWTTNLSTSDQRDEGALKFDIDAALRSAATKAGNPAAVFLPAHHTLLASPSERQDEKFLDDLNSKLRLAALRGRVFDVLALACVAAVTGMGQLADALVAAITTRAFATAVDRGGRRIAYSALSNLARPGGVESRRAVEACTYLMRRDRPGRDEMELLAPAMLQSNAIDPYAELLQFAQWLKWEDEKNPDSAAESGLSRFSHVARNLGCTFDSCGYRQLTQALPSMAEDRLGVLLVRHLSDESNDALLVRSQRPQPSLEDETDDDGRGAASGCHFVACARVRVARVTDPQGKRRAQGLLSIAPNSMVAQSIAQLRQEQPRQPWTGFSDRRRGALRHA